MKSTWAIPEAASAEIIQICKTFGADKYIASILSTRGITSKDEIIQFLYPELNNLYSPFLMNGVYEAVFRIRKAIYAKERIAIFADSDLDGITSLTILYDLLSKCGSIPFIRYPKNKEGYGLTCDIIDEFISENIDLMITVDSGIRDIDEITYAKSHGIDVVITDHHEPDAIHPDAIIINPKMPGCHYPFKELAGVGVAFKLAHALLFSYTGSFDKRFILINNSAEFYTFIFVKNGIVSERENIDEKELAQFLNEHVIIDDYLVFCKIHQDKVNVILENIKTGTSHNFLHVIAAGVTGKVYKTYDSMSAELFKSFKINKNTSSEEDEFSLKFFIELQMRSSLKMLEKLQNYIALVTVGTIADIMPLYGENRNLIIYGLDVLKRGKGHTGIQTMMNKSEASSKAISWDIAPLLNTPGRLGETDLTVNFFINRDELNTGELLKQIEKLNRERRKIVAALTDKIKNLISLKPEINSQKIFFYMDDEIKEGLAGLIASRIADEIKKPVIIATGDSSSDLLKGSGRSYGNFNFFSYVEPHAALFERIGGHAQAFGFTASRDKIIEIISRINDAIGDNYSSEEIIRIDTIMNSDDINSSFIETLSLLEPFGKNNEEPVFVSFGIEIESFAKFGTSENHGRYVLKNGVHAIGWNIGEKMAYYAQSNKAIDIVFNLENNIYNNRIYPRLKIIDLDFN